MYQISCEDEIVHTSASPVCSDKMCPCQPLVTLHAARLEFVVFGVGTGAVHARDARDNAATMCGLTRSHGITPLQERSQRITRLCGRCLASLRTYGGGQVTIEREEKS